MESLTEAWMNDYLDLYIYAGSIGDRGWQDDILAVLRDKEVLKETYHAMMLRELWNKFDRINQQLVEVFAELRSATVRSRTEVLQEKWMKLRIERNKVTRKILSYK
ncbi:hypothetical protein [Paenibacillus kobensis]|uniref:hypothetical protein n=1 Tax=Paenibacillus kobensis TaxID=59841 RepID=UPI000FD71DD9|nr:hypothetical protein [Paenibacillus kobensis]